MRRISAAAVILLLVSFFAAVPAAADPDIAPLRPTGLTPDYHGEEDGPVYMATDPEGNLWAVWSYRNGIESDIAVTRNVGRTWLPPVLLGAGNGRNDLDPRIAFDVLGRAVVTWWQEGTEDALPRVLLSRLEDGVWKGPWVWSPEGVPAHHPNIFPGDDGQLHVAYIDDGNVIHANGVDIKPIDRPDPDGGTNGPDPIPSLVVGDPDDLPGGAGGGVDH